MVIGRSEDRDTPRNPLVLRHHVLVWDPIRATHLGQRSDRPRHKGRTYDRNRPAPSQLQFSLRAGGRPHMGFRALGLRPSPGMTSISDFLTAACREDEEAAPSTESPE